MRHETGFASEFAQIPAHLERTDTVKLTKSVAEVSGVAVTEFDGNFFQCRFREQAGASQPHSNLMDLLARAGAELVLKFPLKLAYTQAARVRQVRDAKAGSQQLILEGTVQPARCAWW